jgi:hypothetical protein
MKLPLSDRTRLPALFSLLLTVSGWLLMLAALGGVQFTPTQAAPIHGSMAAFNASPVPKITFLPLVQKPALPNPFGIETHLAFDAGNQITSYTTRVGATYARMNDRISWRELQPEENDPINWDLLASFESELRTLQAANITPVIIVDDYPRWATDNTVRLDGLPTSCGPLLPERYADFAGFMQALVARYSTPEFNVHIWEMGNEPDVDPNTVGIDSPYGCWGDADDPFYNGRAYGQMLMAISPGIQALDPQAQVWIGGLLLATHYSDDGNIGQPEDFFRGILEAGAAPYFDMVVYHAYVHYSSTGIDMDLNDSTWAGWGGIIRGKAAYLRSIMAEYGIDKPLIISETSQLCGWCDDEPGWLEIYLPGFYDMQANMPARMFPRAMAADISGFIWYPLEERFWQYGSLLDQWMLPKPVYHAYQAFNQMVANATFIGFVPYDLGIEAYTFHKGAFRIDIIFAVEDGDYPISIPQADYIAAYDRFGALITPTLADSAYSLTIHYEPIYLVRTR